MPRTTKASRIMPEEAGFLDGITLSTRAVVSVVAGTTPMAAVGVVASTTSLSAKALAALRYMAGMVAVASSGTGLMTR